VPGDISSYITGTHYSLQFNLFLWLVTVSPLLSGLDLYIRWG